MSVWRMPLMRNVESIDWTPGTDELPESRFTVSPNVAVASSIVSGKGIVQITSSMTGMFPNEQRRHFCAAPGVPGASPRPNGTRFTAGRLFPYRAALFDRPTLLDMMLSPSSRRFVGLAAGLLLWFALRCVWLTPDGARSLELS